MKASQLASNALRSSVPKVPKSSVIKSSIEVHPIAFNSSLFILIFNESCELRVAFSLCKKHDDYLEEMAIHFILRQISHHVQCYYGTAYAYSRAKLINRLSYGTDLQFIAKVLQIEEVDRTTSLHTHIDIAIFLLFTTSGRAEQADFLDAVCITTRLLELAENVQCFLSSRLHNNLAFPFNDVATNMFISSYLTKSSARNHVGRIIIHLIKGKAIMMVKGPPF